MTKIIMTCFFYTAILFFTTYVGSAESRIIMLARVGSSALLPCDSKNTSPNPHVEWRTITDTVFERMGKEFYQGEGYKERVDVPEDKLNKGNCSLVLNNIRVEDSGVYESYLLVKTSNRSLQTKRVFIQSVELSVEEMPEESSYEKLRILYQHLQSAADTSRLQLQILGLSLLSCLLFSIL